MLVDKGFGKPRLLTPVSSTTLHLCRVITSPAHLLYKNLFGTATDAKGLTCKGGAVYHPGKYFSSP